MDRRERPYISRLAANIKPTSHCEGFCSLYGWNWICVCLTKSVQLLLRVNVPQLFCPSTYCGADSPACHLILINTEGLSFVWVIVHACFPSSASLALGLHAYFHLVKGLVHIAALFVRQEETWLSDQYVKYVNYFVRISGAKALKLFIYLYIFNVNVSDEGNLSRSWSVS